MADYACMALLPQVLSECFCRPQRNRMMTRARIQRLHVHRLSAALLMSALVNSAPCLEMTGHHGGVITRCTDPEFYQESPSPEARINRLEEFGFTASENTVPESIQAYLNLTPVRLEATKNGNGTFRVKAHLAEPLTKGRAWIKVTAHSDDGCEQLHTWNVYVAEEPRETQDLP